MNEEELRACIEEFIGFIRSDAKHGDEKLRQTLLLFAREIERTATQRAHSTVAAILEVIDRREKFGSRDVWKLCDTRAKESGPLPS